MSDAGTLDPALASTALFGGGDEVTSSGSGTKPTATVPNPGKRRIESGELEALMERYVDGSSEAFDEIYRLTSPKVYSYLLRLTRQRERAEDLLQVTYSKVHRARASYLRGAPLLPWMLAIARRSFFDERRAQKSRSEDLSYDGDLPEPESEINPVSVETAAALEKAMRRLPEGYREAIELTKVSGLSTTEAAELLGTTQSAVKLRVHRAYTLLRKTLGSYGRGLP